MSPTTLRCQGCGAIAPSVEAQPLSFRCSCAADGDDTDHVLVRDLHPRGVAFSSRGASPFARYRALFHAYHTALGGGISDPTYVELVEILDARVADVDGRGFRPTPLARSEALSGILRFREGGGVWVKDETRSVGESHKARHLMGLLIYLEVLERLGHTSRRDRAPLAIASCGNAALAAAVVACAGDRELHVYVPEDADPEVLERIEALGAQRVICAREPGIPGDPSVRAFRAAVRAGAIPFCCQGSEAGLTIDGGATLGAELADAGDAFDAVLIQVGGGALASSVMRGFSDALALGRIHALPRFFAVQASAVSPLRRAYDRVADRVLSRLGGDPAGSDEARAARIREADPAEIEAELRFAATHRSQFMWPWETEPRSLARAIIDDETYDWLSVVRGMLLTGGYPITVAESTLSQANALAREATTGPVGPSGSAGLAGLLDLLGKEPAIASSRVAVIFSGSRG